MRLASLPVAGTAFGGGPARACLHDARWHFQHGPIDLIIDFEGDRAACAAALAASWEAFQSILPALVEELALLRRPTGGGAMPHSAVARRMHSACDGFSHTRFLTCMAAVAGAVADELITHFHRPGIVRACINNGGDIALHLTPGARYRVGVMANLDQAAGLDGAFSVDHSSPVRGIATSGWRGRSFSLGVADSVTVLASTAAAADAAATLIANAVDCAFAGIVRAPASALKDDSDLGDLAVTVQVPALPPEMRICALARGRREAELWRDRGMIHAAALFLQGDVEIVQP